MEKKPLRNEDAEHQAAQELLPWFATGALERLESHQVERHLRHCQQCRADLELQRRLSVDAARHPSPGADADPAWQRLRSRLHAPAQAAPGPARTLRRPSWTHWTLAGAAALIAAFAILPASLAPRYHGLGRAGGDGDIVVAFRPDTSEKELRQILRASGARLADGPTAADAYVLRVERGTQEQALVALRREPRVTMAEPLNARGGH